MTIFYSKGAIGKISFFLSLLVLAHFFLTKESSAMGGIENMSQDQGIIGDKKTKAQERVYHDAIIGANYHLRRKGTTYITPVVVNDIAHFEFDFEYSFDFICSGWEYNIKSGIMNIGRKERFGYVINLESPDRNTFIGIKKLDLIAGEPLNTQAKEKQPELLPKKAIDDPFVGEERILATKQAIEWLLHNDLGEYKVTSNFFDYDEVIINNKNFVELKVDISDGLHKKRCIIWALNYWGYREGSGERRMLVWAAKIISSVSDFDAIINMTKMIPETLKFTTSRTRNQTVYSDLLR